METESIVFMACLFALPALGYWIHSCEDKRWKGMLAMFVAAAWIMILANQKNAKESEGKFLSPESLEEGSQWKVLFLAKTEEGKLEGIIRNLRTKENKPIEFKEKEVPSKKFEAGKMYGFIGWRYRELIPLEK